MFKQILKLEYFNARNKGELIFYTSFSGHTQVLLFD